MIGNVIIGSAEVYEKIINASIILIGSFQDTRKANDIDLIILYQKYDFFALRKLKNLIAIALDCEFGLPIHYTTLSYKEYFQMEQLQVEKHRIVYAANCFIDVVQ